MPDKKPKSRLITSPFGKILNVLTHAPSVRSINVLTRKCPGSGAQEKVEVLSTTPSSDSMFFSKKSNTFGSCLA